MSEYEKIEALFDVPFSKMDCYSLVRKMYQIRKNINIPPSVYNYKNPKGVFSEFIKEASSNWRRCERKGDCLVAIKLDLSGHPDFVTHMGYMLSPFEFIHTTAKNGVEISKVSDFEALIEGYYEYKGMK